LPALRTVIAVVNDPDEEKWSKISPRNRSVDPWPEVEPIGVDSIHAILASRSLSTIIINPVGEAQIPDIAHTEWQSNGLTGSIIARYTGTKHAQLIVIRNLSRSHCRGCWDPSLASEDDTESWVDSDTVERVQRGDKEVDDLMGYRQGKYRWRTAVSYGERSIPTSLFTSLNGGGEYSIETWETSGTHELSTQAKRLLDCWESAGYPWEEPDWWKFASSR